MDVQVGEEVVRPRLTRIERGANHSVSRTSSPRESQTWDLKGTDLRDTSCVVSIPHDRRFSPSPHAESVLSVPDGVFDARSDRSRVRRDG